MEFQEILDRADYNAVESKYKERDAFVKKYSSVLPPPKKVPKSNVQSESIKKFLEKRKKEEEAKAAEARRQKEKLLALRAQSSKNSKKAKIMASRTKDNDFSKIRLTEDEVEAKKKREAELIRQNLANKVERMKARIEMEEKEKLLPKKRKRKSKNGEHVENFDDHSENLRDSYRELNNSGKNYDKNVSDKNNIRNNNIRKPSKPPPSNFSLTELLKIAEKKQFEPVDIVVKKKEEGKLMTKKERKIMEEDLARQRRKQERLLQIENGSSSKSSNSAQNASLNKKKMPEKSEGKKPVVIRVEKDVSKSIPDTSKFKIPKSAINASSNKNVKHKDTNLSSGMPKPDNLNSSSTEKPVKSSFINGQKKVKLREESISSNREMDIKKKVAVPKKNGIKVNPVQTTLVKQTESQPKFDEEAFKASIEQKIREKIERELEEKLAAKIAQIQTLQLPKPPEPPKPVKKEPIVVNNIKKVAEKPVLRSKKDIERMIAIKKQILEQRSMKPKLPETKSFHKNPYLDPPRRLLEPQRPPRPLKRRVESDDDDDDDDMSDFIDDGPSQNEEDYSKYIKEIFGYDRNRYVDDDDDDIMESSFAEQMKEEVRSARLGYLEDLEEERLELERQKKKKKKK